MLCRPQTPAGLMLGGDGVLGPRPGAQTPWRGQRKRMGAFGEMQGSLGLGASFIWDLLGPELSSMKGEMPPNSENCQGMEGGWSVSGYNGPNGLRADPSLCWPGKQMGHRWTSATQA